MNEEQFRQLMEVLKSIKEAVLLSMPIEEEPLDLIKNIQSAFYHQLEAKTGWGRNEIKEIFEVAVESALE